MFVFDPVDFSIEENQFLLDNVGLPTSVALSKIRSVPLAYPALGKGGVVKDKNPVSYPDGVNPSAVKPVLDRVNELNDLQTHNGEKWVGVEVIKGAIKAFLEQNAKWERENLRTAGRAPRWPSLYSFDSKGKGHLSGPGSDSAKVRTYFGEDGKRVPFAVPLIPDTFEEYKPTETDALTGGIFTDRDKNRIECSVCGHTEQFKQESRSSFNAARARMSRHLRNAKDETERHREIHTNEFGG